ncbi:MAG: DinB family protein [Bryobacteraceae bacterium]
MPSQPQPGECAPYYFTYIDQVPGGDVIATLERQLTELEAWCASISEERSLHRYEPGKWSIREVLNHINDTERVFVFRALWFARGFPSALPAFEQNSAVEAASADSIAWASHVAEWRAVRQASIEFFRSLPEHAWTATGIASENPFTVNSLAYIVAGHSAHHLAILRERYA